MLKGKIMVKLFIIFPVFMCHFVFAGGVSDGQPEDILSGVWEKLCFNDGERYYFNATMVIDKSVAVYAWKTYLDDQCEKKVVSEGWSGFHMTLQEPKLEKTRQEGQYVFDLDAFVYVGPHYQCEGFSDLLGVDEVEGGGKHLYFGKSSRRCVPMYNRPVELDRETGPFVYKGPFTQTLKEYAATLKRSKEHASAKELEERHSSLFLSFSD